MVQESLQQTDSRAMRADAWTMSRERAIGAITIPALVMALVLFAGAAFWVWYGVAQRSINLDDGISLIAAQGILEHGFQILPSGFLYHRAYLPHHLLAGSIGLFGLNDLSIMLPSLLMSLGSVFIVYQIAKNIFGKPWIGVLAAIIMVLAQPQMSYATSPRMYMSLQFFALLSAYTAWRGFVDGERTFKLVALLATLAAILSHRQGVALIVALPVALTLVMLITERNPFALVSKWTVAAIVGLIAIAGFVVAYQPPGTTPLVTAFVEQTPGLASLKFDLVAWISEIAHPKRAVFYAISLAPVIALITTVAITRKPKQTSPGLVYVLTIFTLSFIMLIAATTRVNVRLWLFILPFFAIIVSWGTLYLIERFGSDLFDQAIASKRRAIVTAGVSLVAVIVIAWVALLGPLAGITAGAARTLGPVCNYWTCEPHVENHYANLNRVISPNDLLVSTTPHVTNYYMGRVDAYLREKVIVEGEHITQFDSLTDEYFGIPLFDDKDLNMLTSGDQKVWIVTDPRAGWTTSYETKRVLHDNFELHSDEGSLTTFVFCPGASCASVQSR